MLYVHKNKVEASRRNRNEIERTKYKYQCHHHNHNNTTQQSIVHWKQIKTSLIILRLNFYNCKFGRVNEAIVVFDTSKKVYIDIRQNDIAEGW